MRRVVFIAALLAAPLVAAFVYAMSLATEEPVPWGLVDVSSDEKTLTINWPRGDPHCFELGRIEKSETAMQVTIEVIRERCEGGGTDVYKEGTSEVELDEPLGDRSLIDRCAGEPPPPARELGEHFGELRRAGLARGGPTSDPNLNICPQSSLVQERET